MADRRSMLVNRLRPVALVGWLTLGSCAPEIALGGDCLPLGQPCPLGDAAPGFDATPSTPDASVLDAGSIPDASDAGGAHDAATDGEAQLPDAAFNAPDASVAPDAGASSLLPAIRNPSFELQNGSPPGELILGSSTDIEPWYGCQVQVDSGLRVDEDALAPNAAGDLESFGASEGNAFVTQSFAWGALPIPLLQELEQPLLGGQRYAFVVDVRADTGGQNLMSLEVRGGSASCDSLTTLATSDPIPDGAWTPICITFTPWRDFNQLALQPLLRAAPVIVTARLFIDNVRSDPSCN